MRTLLLILIAACKLKADGEVAEKNCQQFIKDNFVDLRATHTCMTEDTDSDGYVTCTVFVFWNSDKQPTAYDLQCSGSSSNSGCKMTQPKINKGSQ